MIVWDTSDWRQLQVLKGNKQGFLSVVFSTSCEQVASGSNDNKVSVWDVKSGDRRLELAKHEQEGDRAIAWHSTGKLLIATDRKLNKGTENPHHAAILQCVDVGLARIFFDSLIVKPDPEGLLIKDVPGTWPDSVRI